jgi:2-iminobutanoate/2-iminopropanoate deaminase
MSQKTRRTILTGAVAALAASSAEAAEPKLEKKVIRTGPKPAKPDLFSPAIQYGNLLFVSGIGAHFEGDIKAHTQKVLDDIKARLEQAGSSMDKVLKCTVFLADLKDYDAMNDVFRGKFGDEPPVRTTVAVSGLPGKSLVEIDVIAFV